MSDPTTPAPETSATPAAPAPDASQAQAAPSTPATPPPPPPAPTIDIAALTRLQADLAAKEQALQQQQQQWQAEQQRLRPTFERLQKLEQLQGDPLAQAQALGVDLTQVAKRAAETGPLPPQVVEALGRLASIEKTLPSVTMELETMKLERAAAPLLDSHPAVKSNGVSAATVAQHVMALRARGIQATPEQVVAQMSSEITQAFERVAPVMSEDMFDKLAKARGYSKAPKATPAPGISNNLSSQSAPPADPARLETPEERLAAALAIGRALGGGQ